MSKGKIKQKRFVFYRVIKEPGEAASRVEVLPRKRKGTLSELSKICCETYGDGDFVALELPMAKDGLPLSYWIIKVRSKQHRKAMEIKLDADEKAALRSVWFMEPSEDGKEPILQRKRFENFYGAFQTFTGLKMSAYDWQHGVEASAVANYLDTLEEPIKKYRSGVKIKGGRPRDPLVNEAERLQKAKVKKNERIKKLIEFQKESGRKYSDEELQTIKDKAFSAEETARKRPYRSKGRNS